MNRITIMSVGVFLLIFGLIWVWFALAVDNISLQGNGTDLLILELVSLILAPLGTAMIVYGWNAKEPSQTAA